jgi:hypothetical protein
LSSRSFIVSCLSSLACESGEVDVCGLHPHLSCLGCHDFTAGRAEIL